VLTKGLDLGQYKNELGFELIAEHLGIGYPNRNGCAATLLTPPPVRPGVSYRNVRRW
jgi:hypothetical protein